MTAPKHPLFNLRLSPDARMRLRLIAGHKGLDTEAAAVRWLIAEKWEELKGDIAVAYTSQNPKIVSGLRGGKSSLEKRVEESALAYDDWNEVTE